MKIGHREVLVMFAQESSGMETQALSQVAQIRALIGMALNGDGLSFTQLIDPYRKLICSHARRITGNAADADDVFQSTLLKALVALKSLRDIEAFGSWIQRIAIHESYAVVRRRNAGGTSIDDENGMGADMLPPERGPSALERCIDEERWRLLSVAMRHLSRRQTEVLKLRMSGCSHAEIGQQMAISEGVSKITLHRAINKLRFHLTGIGEPAAAFAGE
jgi:RNA polymerase sigma factor (sigma-70 family)